MIPHNPSFIIRAGLAVLILVIAVSLAVYFKSTKQETQKRVSKPSSAVLVTTEHYAPRDHVIRLKAMGLVSPSLETSLKSRVSGEIIETSPNFVPGGFFMKDDVILKIDPRDYELAVQKAKSAVAQAQANLSLEMGKQAIARDELKILKQSTGETFESTDLALRKPQLQQAQANLDEAKANLALAELDLERTEVKAPFNGLIIARSANLGDMVSAQEALATLVSSDEYWIEISVPVYDLSALDLPSPGAVANSAATIVLDGARGTRTGKLARVTGSLDSASRLVTMLVQISDPLLLQEAENLNADKNPVKSPLVLGDYVQVVLDGKTLGRAVRLPLSVVRDGQSVWIMRDGKMAIQKINIAYKDRDYAYVVQGITEEDAVVTSDIAAPIEGMELRIQGAETTPVDVTEDGYAP